MPATFLRQCDHTLGKPMVEYIRQNRDKHVRHPQVHGDLLRLTCFNASRTSHLKTKPSQPAASASPRRRSRLNSYGTPEPGGQNSRHSDHR